MSTSKEDPKLQELPNRAEFLVRRVFERIGAAIDFTLRRGGQPRTDLATLSAHLERAVEENARPAEDAGVQAPNLLTLRYDYETWMRMGADRREYLERELARNLYEYVYNRRYKTVGEMQVRIAYDAFTRGLEVKAEFGQPVAADAPSSAAPAESAAPAIARCECHLRGLGVPVEATLALASDLEPAGVGRNIGNAVVIKDPTVSNFHAVFVLRPDGTLEVADRGSANGTFVNGVMLESAGKCIVRDGDRVRFGEIETRLTIK